MENSSVAAKGGAATTSHCESGRYLTFSLGNVKYGIKILDVQEIIGLPPMTRVPDYPPEVEGIIDLRGNIVPILNLRRRFSMPEKENDNETCVIIMALKGKEGVELRGGIVDRVHDVVDFHPEDLDKPPMADAQDASVGAVVGIGKKQGAVTLMLDSAKTFLY